MRRIIIVLVLSLLLVPKTRAQDDGVVAAVAGLATIGATIFAIDQLEEQAELKATEYVLSMFPEMTSFSLKTLDFDGKKAKDMSSVSLITYKIQEFQLKEEPELDGKKFVLFGFTSYGWVSDYGVDFSKVSWFLIDAEEWLKMMVAYVKTASTERDENFIKEKLKAGKIVNKGVRESDSKFKLAISFYKMNGDMYSVSDYNESMKFVYNERSLGIYLNETSNLVQIGRGDIIKIHEFFFDVD